MIKDLLTRLIIFFLLIPLAPKVNAQGLITTRSSGGGIIPALVTGQVCSKQASANDTCVLPGNDTTANAIVFWAWTETTQTVTPTMTGASFSQVPGTCNDGFFILNVWIAPNITGGQTTITATTNAAVTYVVHAAEFSNVASSSPFDSGAGDITANCNSTTLSASPIISGTSGAPSTSNELAVGLCVSNANTTMASGNGYTDVENTGNNVMSQYKIVSGTTSANCTSTTTGQAVAASVILIKHA